MYFDSQLTEGVNSKYDTVQARQPNNDESIAVLKESRLLARGGFQIERQLFSKESLWAMFDEACRLFANSSEELRENSDIEEWRGGLPPRKLLTTGGGPVQDRLYRAHTLQVLLSQLIGVPVQASRDRAGYSYYCRPGDYLGLHRDVETCDISVIVVLSDNTDSQQEGGELILYPKKIQDPLSVIRQNPKIDAVPIKLAAGETCILAGGMVPHLVRPVGKGQYRITAPMCFKVMA